MHYYVFLGFNRNPSSWARFMQKTLNGARYAPESCFKRVSAILDKLTLRLPVTTLIVCSAHLLMF